MDDAHVKDDEAKVTELSDAIARLVDRACKCGCGNMFRVLPESTHVYASERCAINRGWQEHNSLFAVNELRVLRRWHNGAPPAPWVTQQG